MPFISKQFANRIDTAIKHVEVLNSETGALCKEVASIKVDVSRVSATMEKIEDRFDNVERTCTAHHVSIQGIEKMVNWIFIAIIGSLIIEPFVSKMLEVLNKWI